MAIVRLSLLLALVLACAAVDLPDRFSADVISSSSWGNFNCRGLPLLTKIYQDVQSNLSYWSHHLASEGPPVKEVLIMVPADTADPTTPYTNHLTRFSWNSNSSTSFENCTYDLLTDHQVPKFFNLSLPVLEKKEVIGGVMCEKWSNNAPRPHSSYWAAWFPVDAYPTYSVVKEAQYIGADHPAHSNPYPGCMLMYNFTNFSTAPIPPKQFQPPPDWVTKCINTDGGLNATGLPPKGYGYFCVGPGRNKTFAVALKTKPFQTVTIQLKPCGPRDSCWYGGKCKNCVKFSRTVLVFKPNNWSVPQIVEVMYLRDGEGQFTFTSPNYYMNDIQDTRFFTLTCASGECSNKCWDS